jgi:hypothetical protein
MTDRNQFVQALRDAIAPHSPPSPDAPLCYPSETDAPLDVVIWQVTCLSADTLKQQLNLPPETPLEERPISAFFDRVTCDVTGVTCAWQGPDAADLAQRYRILRDLMQTHLQSLAFYRLGRVEIAAYVVGQYDPTSWIGIATQLVET